MEYNIFAENNQYVLTLTDNGKSIGSLSFKCEPRRGIIKTISEQEKNIFIAIINNGIQENWNGESIPPTNVFNI